MHNKTQKNLSSSTLYLYYALSVTQPQNIKAKSTERQWSRIQTFGKGGSQLSIVERGDRQVNALEIASEQDCDLFSPLGFCGITNLFRVGSKFEFSNNRRKVEH